MELKIVELSNDIKDACYSGYIFSGHVVAHVGEGAKIDGKGILMEILGEERIEYKNGGEAKRENLFKERTPRSIVTLMENSYYQTIQIDLPDQTKIYFDILVPEGLNSSFKGEYEDCNVFLEYKLRVSANINNTLVKNEIPIYMSKYPFATIDWFSPELKDISEDINRTRKESATETVCFCCKKEVEVEKSYNLTATISYSRSIEAGKPLSVALKLSHPDFFKPDKRLALMFAEVFKIGEDEKKIIKTVEEHSIKKIEPELHFSFNTSNLERSDFSYKGVLFSRYFCLVLQYVDEECGFEVIAEVDVLSPNNYKLAKSIVDEAIEERKVKDLLETVSFEGEKMY